jgi:hypothetical protein
MTMDEPKPTARREKAGGRYTVGFSLRLPARFSGAVAISDRLQQPG